LSEIVVTLPEMGESVTEGSIVEWRVKAGEWIEEGATLVDVTTDKVDVEVPATASGIVTKLGAAEGDTIAVGGALAAIDTAAAKPDGGAVSAPANGASPLPQPPKPVDPPVAAAPGGATAGQSVPRSGDAGAGLLERPAASNGAANGSAPAAPARVASHRAKRLADRAHLDWTTVRGTGPGGLVVLDDIAEAAKHPEAHRAAEVVAKPSAAAPALPPVGAEARVSPLKGPAGALVGYMEQSLTIPTATSFRTFAVSELERRRAELNASLKTAGRAEKISFTHVIAFALVRAAVDVPSITASFRRENGTPSRVDGVTSLGLAVDATRKDGSRSLVVPVIKNAHALDFAQFRSAYEDLVVKARDSKLSADELSGASFTLTNPGGIGTVASVPRLMAGQGAIIAAGAIGFPPGLQNADPAALEQLGVEKILTLTSTYDHRVIQGAQSGEYLRRVEQLLAGADGFYEAAFAAYALTTAVPGNAGANGVRATGAVATSAAPAAASTASPQRAAPGAPPRSGSPVTVLEQTPTGPREHEAYSNEMLKAVAAGMSLLSSYRRHGHLGASLDPLGTPPIGDPALDVRTYNLTPSIMAAVPANVLRTNLPGDTLASIVPELQKTYSSTIAYEVEHIANIEQREWLREYIETGGHRAPLDPGRAVQVLGRLTKVEAFERFLRKTFIGSKTFSIEGLDVMVPMLEELISLFADDGVGTAVLGMAHRGRLATIAHVVNRPYEEILAEFEAAGARGEHDDDDDDATGDVKYHHGASGTYRTPSGREIAVALANNPSHLEAVDGVVEGRTRALQTHHETPVATQEIGKGAPVLIHGDAAFGAQGIVAEVLNLQALRGYATGGTIHIIANNQIGFTTDPFDARSTRYASDLAKGFDVPIVHVNADDVDACMSAVHLALDFRRRFGHDAIIDLIGYRRFGHNETDEPAYTQPDMYERIKTHPTVRELYAQKLIAQNVVTPDAANGLIGEATARLQEAHRHVKAGEWHRSESTARSHGAHTDVATVVTSVPRERLLAFSDALVAVPEGFTPHPKLARQLERRRAAFAQDGEMDYGLAESLAFASLLEEGVPIRLTGQDTERGTFSHRHLVMHDPKTGREYVPIQHLAGSTASFELYNSPLSEYACLGFEYGYSVELPYALVLWEAQFGDFMNGAQIIIDQFIAAGHAKWGESSRLVMLLPHGYEGAGPEHSSARIERFLQLSAEGNVHIANCTTAAQYFHLLRLQARSTRAIPLVVFTPKSLLRLKLASGTAESLSSGTFQPVIDDARHAGDRSKVERIVLCSGKIYYDLVQHESYATAADTAVVRIELLSPLPIDDVAKVFATYPNLKEVVWAQEEPMNMGARAHVRRRLMARLPAGVSDISYVGRPYRASPSEGYGGAHALEQDRIVSEALAPA